MSRVECSRKESATAEEIGSVGAFGIGCATVDVEAPVGIDTRRVTIASATPHRASDPLRLEVRLTAASTVRLEIFDVAGRRLAIVSSGRLDPGTHDLVWRPGTRDAGARFLRVSTDRWTETRMVQLLP